MTEMYLIAIMVGFLIVGFVFNYNEIIKMFIDFWNDDR